MIDGSTRESPSGRSFFMAPSSLHYFIACGRRLPLPWASLSDVLLIFVASCEQSTMLVAQRGAFDKNFASCYFVSGKNNRTSPLGQKRCATVVPLWKVVPTMRNMALGMPAFLVARNCVAAPIRYLCKSRFTLP